MVILAFFQLKRLIKYYLVNERTKNELEGI